MALYTVERLTSQAILVDRSNSLGSTRILNVSVGKATGPRGPGTAFERMSINGNLQPGTGQVPLRFHRAVTVASMYADVPPANVPSGGPIVFDANLNGVTMFTNQANRPKILAGQAEGASVLPDVIHIPANGKVTIDVDLVGTVVAGANALITIEYY
jgi:hypothetical protein